MFKRLIRFVFNLSTLASLLLVIGAAALWIRSLSREDIAKSDSILPSAAVRYVIQSNGGNLTIQVSSTPRVATESNLSLREMFPARWSLTSDSIEDNTSATEAKWAFHGNMHEARFGGPEPFNLEISFPTWALTILAGILPLLNGLYRLKPSTVAGDTCNYDLRAALKQCQNRTTAALSSGDINSPSRGWKTIEDW